MVRINKVFPESIAAKVGMLPGTELAAVNGKSVEDFLDWEFLSAEDHLVVAARSPDGEEVEYDIERPEGEALGIELDPPSIRRCANRCDFCFVDGLPEGLRNTLYIRDDDYRLSFRHGNFATLTNLKQKDIDRIIEYRLSPLYVSVHATDTLVRRRLLRNPLAPDVVEQIRLFGEHGIRFHTQIVLQPGLNDGAHLENSVRDLWELGDLVLSVSVVPVGLTEFSKHNLVREPTADECAGVLDLVHAWQRRARGDGDCNWIYGSDDLYLIAGADLPKSEEYDGFEQLENGVGSVRFLIDRVTGMQPSERWRGKTIGVFTGTAMGRHMPKVLDAVAERTGARCELFVLENSLFGSQVTSAGLLPGAVFREALCERSDIDLALLPGEVVNDHDAFMDDLHLDDITAAFPGRLELSYDFADVLGGGM